MKIDGKVATWLELVIAPHWRKAQARFRLHPIDGTGQRCKRCRETCYAVTVDGRWLYSNDGRLTVLRGRATAERFMQLVRHQEYEAGAPVEFDLDCATGAHCIAINSDRTLRSCRQAATIAA